MRHTFILFVRSLSRLKAAVVVAELTLPLKHRHPELTKIQRNSGTMVGRSLRAFAWEKRFPLVSDCKPLGTNCNANNRVPGPRVDRVAAT